MTDNIQLPLKKVNLIYYQDKQEYGNFGDELSKYITQSLINKDKYELVFNQKNQTNLICIGSYIHKAKNNTFIYGSGVRTNNNIENGHKYNKLNVCAIRGPLSKDFLEKKNVNVPEVYGDPALLLPIFYQPLIINELKDKIGIIPHKSNYNSYKINKKILNNKDKYYLINPRDQWQNVINYIYSCKCIISSSLHGLICSDAYNKPNLWIDEFPLQEGDFKFKDYFASQNRDYIKIKKIEEFKSSLLYSNGNTIDLDKLINYFPFG